MTDTAPVSRRRLLLAALSLPPALALGPGLGRPAHAQSGEPVYGTPGKDSGWIPTPEGMVEAMLRLGQVGADDFVVDLGSGDGRIPILAARRFGARAMGVEFNPDLVAYSGRAAKAAGLAGRVRFVRGDIFETDFSTATVVTLFMPPAFNLKLRPTLLAMKPGTRILSFIFDMGDWEPDESVHVGELRGMLWIVPAQMGGAWTLNVGGPDSASYALRLNQKHQKVGGTITIDSAPLPLFDARINADRIRFTALPNGRRMDFDGRYAEGAIRGTIRVTGERELRRFRAGR